MIETQDTTTKSVDPMIAHVTKNWHGVGEYRFEVKAKRPLTLEDCEHIQESQEGLAPQGYTMSGFNVAYDWVNQVYITTWKCSGSCD